MKSKIVGLFVCMLLIGTVITVSGDKFEERYIVPNSIGKTLYVGGSGSGNYSKIQEAIDDSSSGDTVFVYDDSSPYYENIIIDKTINLIGEDKGSTVIDGNGYMSGDSIHVSADWVNITGFMIQNTGEWFVDYGIEISSKHCTIMGNNIVSNNNDGIRLTNSNNNNILGNYFSQNYYSILLWGSSNNNISGNTIEYEHSGIGAVSHSNFNIISNNIVKNAEENSIYFGSNCDNNTVVNNSLSNSTYGICAYPSSYNNYSDNIINNCDFGLYIAGNTRSIAYRNWITFCGSYGIYLMQSYYDNISSNSISNSGHGIYLTEYPNNYTTINIIDNIITWNSGNGVYFEDSTGGGFTGVDFNIISNNAINHNSGHGICFKNSSAFNISDNMISYNSGSGISLNGSCNNNTIIYNNVNTNNGCSIRLENDFNAYGKNSIYHNNFFNNMFGGYDNCENNSWDFGYPSGGNYWSDYNGTDNNGDGIGDTPYNLSGGDNMDRYPLIDPWGENPPIANYTYFIIGDGGILFDGSLSYDRDGVIDLYEWDFDDGKMSQGMVVTHAYNVSGTYHVKLTITDNDGYQSSFTMSIEAEKNLPPTVPIIDGPTSAEARKSHGYKFTSEDPELADVTYYIEWGDGKVTPWCDFLPSGEIYHASHGWGKGTYTIRCKAKDIYGVESDWSTLEVTIPKNKVFIFNFPLLNWLINHFPDAFPIIKFLLGLN